MKCRLLIRSQAEMDIAEAAVWYEHRRQGLGEDFLQEAGRAIARAQENPVAFPIIRRRHEVRRGLTHRFPYRVFFSLKGDLVVVHAVLHARRHERHLKERL